jgi:prevent-host-death family protein
MILKEVVKMPVKVNVHEAKTHFSKLLAQVGKGEEIIIAKAGKPVARLIPIEERPVERTAGSARSKVIIAEDFDAPLPEFILNSFEQ